MKKPIKLQLSGETKLGLFKGENKPDKKVVWDFYERGLRYNNQIDLEETVRCNENFYVGRQWENVDANGLPTPTFNFIKRVVMFDVATINSDNLKITATPLAHTANTDDLIPAANVVNEEFEALTERNELTHLCREFVRNAAVDGDGCMYAYWDADAETGQEQKGEIRTEVLDNTDVYFGNPTDKNVQHQPYIIIRSSLPTRTVKIRAKENKSEEWEDIKPDAEFMNVMDSAKTTDDMTTLLLILWRDDETKTIWGYECTKDAEVKEAWDLEITLYPLVWLNWDYVKNCYHGQAMVTGILNNQIFVNRAWAMSMLSMMKTAYPKYAIDGTRIGALDNRVGGYVKVNGDPTNAIKPIDPPSISPQVAQYIELAIDETEKCLGATSVALGDTRPDNTSAIIALQRAAATPIELTKQNLHKAIEDLYRIYLEFMSVYYGKRLVDTEVSDKMGDVFAFAGMEMPETIQDYFDFSTLKDHPMSLKLDVGASSYYSEIASINTLDNLFIQAKAISLEQYLERIPDGYIPDRRGLIQDIKQQQQQQMMMEQQMMQQQMGGGIPGEETEHIAGAEPKEEIPTSGGGYSALQRKINAGEDVR